MVGSYHQHISMIKKVIILFYVLPILLRYTIINIPHVFPGLSLIIKFPAWKYDECKCLLYCRGIHTSERWSGSHSILRSRDHNWMSVLDWPVELARLLSSRAGYSELANGIEEPAGLASYVQTCNTMLLFSL